MITVRQANIDEDAPEIMDGILDFAQRVDFRSLLPEDRKHSVNAMAAIIGMDGFELWVAENEGRIVGMIGLLYAPLQWNPAIIAANELFWWVAEDAPYRTAFALIKEVMNDIDARGALPMFRKLTTSPEGVEKVYRKFGMRPVETVYTRF